MECEEFCAQYTKILRMTYQIASSIYKNMRTYISLDHFWTGRNYCGTPTKYYPAREVLERINHKCLTEGQVGWNVAHHPYPENLAFPDFWNDVIAGACGSHFEALIASGANFASSPKRINTHTYDPAVAAIKVATTPINRIVNFDGILKYIENGHDALGGVETMGKMRLLL